MALRLLGAVIMVVVAPTCLNGDLGHRRAHAGSAGETAALAGITAAHNVVRARVGVEPLVWDHRLAATAQAWVDRCVDRSAPKGVIDHNPDRGEGHPWEVGENIFAGTAPVSAKKAVDAWAAEAAAYDYDRNRCAYGRTCGHYTQVVWSESRKVGCATHHCPRFTFGHVIVCDYGPAGNDGGRPY